MQSSETNSCKVSDHYTHRDLEKTIFDALVAVGKNPDNLKIEDLAPIDEFHIRGRNATLELARDLNIDARMHVLDAGCGLGGASRYLAHEFGCSVTGLDLSEDYCRAAAALTRCLGLDSLITFHQGNATSLPFADGTFDIVWTQHATMNIQDKSRLYAEFWRVLKPGGRLAMYDILAGRGGDAHYPVPWAREPSISFLLTSQQLLETLTMIGFGIVVWRDVTETGRSWFRHLRDKINHTGLPALGLHLLLGPDFRLMAYNQVLNLEEDRISLIHAVVERPVTVDTRGRSETFPATGMASVEDV